VLHADFARVSAHEKVEVSVPIEIRGEAPGLKEGGVVEQLAHAIDLECEASDIPEKIDVSVNELELDDSITAGQLKLPSTARLIDAPDRVVVQCVSPVAAPEEETAVAGEAEPEVIGRKAVAEEESEE